MLLGIVEEGILVLESSKVLWDNMGFLLVIEVVLVFKVNVVYYKDKDEVFIKVLLVECF